MTTHELETGQTVMVDVVPRTTKLVKRVFGFPDAAGTDSCLRETPSGNKVVILKGVKHFECELIGTIQHPGVFSFDPKILGYKRKRWDRDDPYWQPEKSEQELMLADVKSWGYYWDNPLGEEPNINDYTINNDDRTQTFRVSKYNDAKEAWQEAESRKLSVDQMVVLIQVK